jgi:predicted dehydrogenase
VYSRKEHSGGGHGHLQLTHAAGLLFYVTGLRIAGVQARMSNQGLPLDLIAVITAEFEGGALGTVSGTSNSFVPKSRLTIGCAEGSVEFDVTAGTVSIGTPGGERETLGPGADSDLSRAPIRSLIGIARGIVEAGPAAEVGWRAVELLDAAYRSVNGGGRDVRVAELYDAADDPKEGAA